MISQGLSKIVVWTKSLHKDLLCTLKKKEIRKNNRQFYIAFKTKNACVSNYLQKKGSTSGCHRQSSKTKQPVHCVCGRTSRMT